jgi:hypothetical protein
VKPKPLVAALLALAGLAGGCRRDEARAARVRAEKALLERQIEGLRELIAAAETRTLLKAEQLLVGTDEATVQGLIAATLPQERVIANRFRVRLERAEARFRSSQGVVVLKGRASPLQSAGTFVDLTLEGGLDDVTIDQGSGTLVAKIGVYHFEVERAAAAGAEGPAIRALAEALGRERLDELSELVPPVEIPIRLEQSIAFDGLEEGPVSAGAGTLPVRASVARVLALAGRLWVVLDVGAGPWRSGKRAAS